LSLVPYTTVRNVNNVLTNQVAIFGHHLPTNSGKKCFLEKISEHMDNSYNEDVPVSGMTLSDALSYIMTEFFDQTRIYFKGKVKGNLTNTRLVS
jgi:hypothetical protein